MAGRLTATQVKALGEGRHADGGGLYVHVKPNGRRYWKFITNAGGKRREKGLGAFPAVSLADARKAATRIRAALDAGEDPFVKVEPKPSVPTFGEASRQFIGSMEAGWRNPKHRQQWRNTLATHCAAMADKSVAEIDTDDVLDCLTPLWTSKPETASRVRGRVERILDFAMVRGWRERGMNPAAWKGNLALTLPARAKLRRGHHSAMPWQGVPGFIVHLRDRRGVAARALEFAILTATRSGEVRGATWTEIDVVRAIWIVPALRMKAGREHRVPLTARALEILADLPQGEGDELVFPGSKCDRPMSDMTLGAVLKRMKLDCTAHGFRSSFRDWAAEMTGFPHEVCEMALAHTIVNKAEAAYRRGDLFNKRRELMDAWATYLNSPCPKASDMA